MRRRLFCTTSIAALAAAFVTPGWIAAARAADSFGVSNSDAEWKTLLTPAQYAVLRQGATERAFTSKLLDENRNGIFDCAGCDLPLFSSATKYESGTGWPSFWEPLPRAIDTRIDGSVGAVETEVHCARCGGHLGHVYNDGPQPTGLRYCMNGLSLTFKPKSA